MDPSEYLEKILDRQTFGADASELTELRKRRKEIEDLLRANFSSSGPSICWGGSMAKETMIREAYDGDMTCYFPHEDREPGTNLEEIYESVATALGTRFSVERKTSAVRVRDSSTKATKGLAEDLHIDVVPGRFTSDEGKDVYLHRTIGDKTRLKTNLQVHIDHIKDSGVTAAIRLMKLWNVRNGIGAKTFVLELLVVKLLAGHKGQRLADQLLRLWTVLRDRGNALSVEDPANPTGNDLKPVLDQVCHRLSQVGRSTLESIEQSGWEGVFGPVDGIDEHEREAGIERAVGIVVNPTRPWLPRP